MGLDQYVNLRTTRSDKEIQETLLKEHGIKAPYTHIDSLEKLKTFFAADGSEIVNTIDTNYATKELIERVLKTDCELKTYEEKHLFHADAEGKIFAYNFEEEKQEYAQEGYYRKFNALQNFFEEYHNCENCEDIVLTLDILEDIEDRLLSVEEHPENAHNYFPTTSGFFYGSTDYDSWYFDYCKELQHDIKRYKSLIKNLQYNQELVYSCWY